MLYFYDNILKKISKWIMGFGAVVLAIMAVFMVVDVIMRYLFKHPILGDVEIVEVTQAVIVLAGFAFTQTIKGHLSVMMIFHYLPKKLCMVVYSFNSLLVAIAAGATTYALFLQGGYVFGKNMTSAMLGIPYFPFYYYASVMMAFFTLVLLCDAIIQITAIFNKKYEERVVKDW